jgi:hypothetical protein
MDLLPRWFQDGYTVHSSQYTGVGLWGEKLRLFCIYVEFAPLVVTLLSIYGVNCL